MRGWKWRSLEPADKGRASEEVYELFYECVTAARREGFTPVPALKCA
ncbi:MAG TPA: hypothetical protein VD965_03085 [Burkholderiales bacterium]|nr:hypothetical protein [Burkholderiales bacterium]